MEEYLLKFIEWTKLKIRLHFQTEDCQPYFYEREIWWASLGVNVGHEQDGKNANFERPVLILKKFNKDVLWVLPITSQNKTGKYYYQFNYNQKNYSIILSQIRLISSKRLRRRIRTFPDSEFKKVKKSFREIV